MHPFFWISLSNCHLIVRNSVSSVLKYFRTGLFSPNDSGVLGHSDSWSVRNNGMELMSALISFIICYLCYLCTSSDSYQHQSCQFPWVVWPERLRNETRGRGRRHSRVKSRQKMSARFGEVAMESARIRCVYGGSRESAVNRGTSDIMHPLFT